MTCPFCGTQVGDKIKYCPKCGKKIPSQENAYSYSKEPNSYEDNGERNDEDYSINGSENYYGSEGTNTYNDDPRRHMRKYQNYNGNGYRKNFRRDNGMAGNLRSIYIEKSGMYENVGVILHRISLAIFMIGSIISIFTGIWIIRAGAATSSLMSYYTNGLLIGVGIEIIIVGIIWIVLGILFSWIVSLLIYGFGELIIQAKEIAKILRELQQ